MTRWYLTTLLIVAAPVLTWSSCARSGDGDGDGDCDSSEDCDDEIECTFDSCESGECAHQPVDELCGDGETCDVANGCVGGVCVDDIDCDDGFGCTTDICDSSGTCIYRAGDCPAGQECRIGEGCVEEGCDDDGDCADEFDCTVDVCDSDGVCQNIPDNSLCPDGLACRVDTGCREIDCEGDDDCQDGIFCNGHETCDPEFGCMPAEELEDCDDNDECTIDACDAEADRCSYSVNTAIPECDTFELEHLNGCFAVTPNIEQHCAVNFNFNEVCFELVGPVLTIEAGRYDLVQSPAPTDENFTATAEVSGGCTEVYTLTGTFSGSGTFSATWTSEFINVDGFSCLLGGCGNRTIAVTGTRTSGP